jgi:hypothetical protein
LVISGDEKALYLSNPTWGTGKLKQTDRLYIEHPAGYPVRIRQGETSGGTLEIGADTNLYRSGANTLRTDDTLVAKSFITGGIGLKSLFGDWDIVEREDFLLAVNNRTGQKYKIALIPLSNTIQV